MSDGRIVSTTPTHSAATAYAALATLREEAAARLWLARPDPSVLAFLDLDPDAVATALARFARCGDHHDH